MGFVSAHEPDQAFCMCWCLYSSRSSLSLKTLMSRRRRTSRTTWTEWSLSHGNLNSRSRTTRTRVSTNTHRTAHVHLRRHIMRKKAQYMFCPWEHSLRCLKSHSTQELRHSTALYFVWCCVGLKINHSLSCSDLQGTVISYARSAFTFSARII